VPIDSLPRYTAFIYLHPQGKPMGMQVLRDGKTVAASITPEAAPRPSAAYRISSTRTQT
jgi:serine protease Do